MTDRELLEAAARAAGISIHHWETDLWGVEFAIVNGHGWQPLHDYAAGDCMGDALRLAVKLRIEVEPWIHGDSACARAAVGEVLIDEPHYGDDPERATRRAIVRAAAQIGEGMV